MNKKSKSISSFVREQIFLHTKDKATKEFEKEQKQYKKKIEELRLTYQINGNLTLSGSADCEIKFESLRIVKGNLTVEYSDIYYALCHLRKVKGNLTIKSSHISFLNHLEEVTGDVTITNSDIGLMHLKKIGGNCTVQDSNLGWVRNLDCVSVGKNISITNSLLDRRQKIKSYEKKEFEQEK